jgi:hypothetical protein
MKTAFIFTLMLYTNAIFGQESIDTSKLNSLRVIHNDAFTYGERLSFEISYGFLTAAEAFMNISPSPVQFFGRDAYEINFDVNSRSSFDLIYKVRDNYKSYIDTKGIFPWKFEQHIREKDYSRDFEITFDQLNHIVKTKLGSEQKQYDNIPEYVHDIISSFYYARTLDYRNLKEGDIQTVQYFYKDGIYPLDIRFKGREKVDVDAGEFRTIIVEPGLKEGFTSTTSDITIWLTDDDRKIPVKVKMKIIIGALVAELTKYEGLNGPLGSKIE